jgi:hypothetical protein
MSKRLGLSPLRFPFMTLRAHCQLRMALNQSVPARLRGCLPLQKHRCLIDDGETVF